ncbi:DUF6305 family protein [Clostridium cochlearium]|uniref:DUF6305 family protein n=1 Tax=Clostridium cochlearium TaxID=1494 RepID=UPI0031406BD1
MIKGKIKKILLITISAMLTLSLVACGSGDSSSEGSKEDTKQIESKEDGKKEEVNGLEAAIAEQPALLTSVGQSADVEMVKALMDNAGLKYTLNKVATPADIKEEKTLVLAVGGSSKGLGAAGIKAEDELKRAKELINAAKEKGMVIVTLHVGGENRRGELSDKFIAPSIENANYVVVVEDGNKDGLFTKMVKEKDIPMESVKSISDVMTPLKKAFK